MASSSSIAARNKARAAFTHCIGSVDFEPTRLITDPEKLRYVRDQLKLDNITKALVVAFDLPKDDDFRYIAVAEVTLAQAQSAVNAGRKNSLHVWYRDEKGEEVQTARKGNMAGLNSNGSHV